MAKTYQEVQELTLKTVSDITKSPEEWMLYLDTAARMYRYSFQEQMLIHAQRPDATACASYELWQRRFNRVVMRGRKGIALIDTSAQRPKLKYVFDIGDTIRRPDGTTPKLWSIPPAPESEIVQRIADRFQAQPEMLTLDEVLHTLAIDATVDEMDDAMTELLEHTGGSFLEGLDEGNLSVRFRYTMDASLEYMLLARCGLYPRDYFAPEDFRYITEFNTIDTLTVLGNAVSEQANAILTAIGQIARQMRREYAEEKSSAETLDKQNPDDYYTLKRKSEPQNQSEMQGGQDHGTDLSRGDGRDAVPEPDNEGAGGLHPGQVRPDAQAVSGTVEAEPVSSADPEGRAVGASGGRGQERPADGGSDRGTDGGAARRERADEGRASDGVGAADELFHPIGAGNRHERPDLSVSDDSAPEVQSNIPEIRPDGTELSGLDFSSEVTDAFLRAGGNQRHSVLRIIAYHQLQGADFPGFLRNEFCSDGMRTGGRGLIVDGQRYAAWFDLEGIHIAKGTTIQNPNAAHFTWEQAASRISFMLNWGIYQPEVVVTQALSHERLECAESLWYLHQDYNREHERPFFMDEALFYNKGFPDETAAIAEKLADPAFLQQTLTGLNELRLAYAEDKTLLRWHHHHPLFLLERMAKLMNEPLRYPVSERQLAEQAFFITEDEVDDAIRNSSTERSLAFYSYFIHDHTAKEQADFLKDSYGQGGHSHGVSHADDSFVDYDSKGITFRRGSGEHTAVVKLNWQQFAKRVQSLVLSGVFLSQDAIDQIPEYERTQIVRRVIGFYQYLSWKNLPLEPGDYYENMDKIGALIQTEDGVDGLLSGMMRNLTELDQGDAHYEPLMKTYSDVTAYRNGTFSLFTPSTELQAEAEKRGVSLIVHPGRTMDKADMVYLYHEGSTVFLNGNSFEVAEITGESITVRDASFPLSTLIFDRSELDELLRQDSKNDYLLGEPEIVETSEEAIEIVEEPGIPKPVSEIVEPEEPISEAQTEPEEMIEEPSAPALEEIVIDLTPQQPAHEPLNFQITDDALGVGGPKEKFRRNLAAIQLVHRLEDEGRMATAEEQSILAQYVGWGGIPQAFDERNSQWEKEYQQLKAELTPGEYHVARGSTLNAHYTTPVVIREIYAGLERMGFTGGNILEPAMGVGNFFGMLPASLSENSKLYGVELDEITGKIAKQLYQKANISVTGFERTNFSNDFFDVVVGNVPFGNYQVADRQYDRHHFMIHDYFLAKSLDKVRPGGVVAVITSSGTMDKKDDSARRYLAERADLLGAVRLPNNAFSRNAGTDVVTDILFLQKREAPQVQMPEWVSLGVNQEGFSTNRYFVTHPEMVLGEWRSESTQYGKMEATVKPVEGANLGEQLHTSIARIEGRIDLTLREDDELTEDVATIPADPGVRNFSYTVVDGDVFYRENSVMRKVELPAVTAERVRGMVAIRDCTQQLINAQLEDADDSAISNLQSQLNQLYDSFTKKYGLISTQANRRAFANDSSYCLLRSLEVLDNDGNLERKADMFSKRTIKRSRTVDHVDTASEALAVSIADKAAVDLDYMAGLTGRSAEDMIQELQGVIFRDPTTDRWQTADEYLSGNVREKMRMAQSFAENHPEYTVNVGALQRVQPKDLTASEISVRLGAVWIDPDYITQFMGELLHTPGYLLGRQIRAHYSKTSGTWSISGKNSDSFRNVYATKVYGTNAANGYRLLEDCLNLRDTRILRKVYVDGQERTEVDANATMLAQQKQDAIREQFKDWIFRDPQRRAALVREYNERFNSVRPRQYDGSHIRFDGMNPEIKLRKHQLNAVAHVLYGQNTLLAHCVGAGKTYEMAAAAMESKRLGLCEKSLFVVPNHLIEQWASEFLQLYPGANILAATKKDFQPANRKAFCARIATGGYDAVIIGHSQFEKIPLSLERQKAQIEAQIDEIIDAIRDAQDDNSPQFTVKQLEKTRKSLEARLEKLNDQSQKDDVVTFEQLGCDRLFVDESHGYKNLFLYTKMRNVAGVGQTEAKKSSDMFAKCRYMDELTGGRGITFATGTPVSNSMCEMYTLMRYLQYDTLQRMEMGHFDSWAANFGETVTAIELSPEGTGYRSKTRFARFFNLPELIAVFKEAADVQTSDMLQLPVPETVYEDVVLEPSEEQREMVSALGKRAEQVRNRLVEPKEDNMLKITSDGRKLALDQRLMNDMLPDDPNSKVNACVERVFSIWDEGKAERTTQLLFCDLSTPKGDGTFNVYDDIREKLVAKGVPREEVCFIHEADTEAKKIALFARMRSGKARVLIGSSAKCGAGMNIQDRLIALHHLDVPWRPSDIQQREGRIVRQGNQNPQVKIFRYVTKSTFDSYSWQLLEQKQKFIGQIMTSKSPVRSADDIDEAALSYAEVKALASGNPLIKEKMQLDNDVSRLKLMKSNYQSQVYQMQDDIAVNFPKRIAAAQELIVALKADIETAKALPTPELESEQTPLDMVIGGKHFTDRKEAGLAIIAACTGLKEIHSNGEIGSYGGFKLSVTYDVFSTKFNMSIQGMTSRSIKVSKDPYTNIRRIQASIANIPSVLEQTQRQLETLQQQLENTNAEVGKPFPKEQELTEKLARLSELNRLLDNGQSQPARETSDIVADQMRKPSIRDRLKAAQRESQRPQTNDRNRHKTNTMIL